MRDTMKKKNWKSSGEIYILRHWIGVFIAFLAMKISANIEQWMWVLIMFLIIIYNVWHVVMFLIDLAVGTKTMKMQYCRLKDCDDWKSFSCPCHMNIIYLFIGLEILGRKKNGWLRAL